ncbi:MULTISPECIES: cyclic di-GMP phosphodiesterase [unclassified Serratia (in: enterobacteria)]|uniref:cyclic di-GMP phosphodiesterase n=1 Tax=unclassified Serratia (in: enterobacteria) TaxID=2647522 RepID=UPI0004FF858F|nr:MULTISPECIES: cyclic di-GMP phosphodiesterase [unclassified Serratia (in: enterobacteria)]KFK93214.1 phage resistance protein [Serratia sp. Ag2]KFK99653.1 phage resistance protein [Serratia sp. Ag1]
MGLKGAFARHVSQKRRGLIASGLVALIFFIVVTSATLFLISHQRLQYQNQLKTRTEKLTLNYLDHLKNMMQEIMPLTSKPCAANLSNLTYRAAFTNGVRTFLLVKDGIAYCSSATGDMRLAVNHLYPEIDWQKPLDMQLQQGTPLVPDKPVIALWLRQSGQTQETNTGVLATLDLSLAPYLLMTSQNNDAPGLAIVVGGKAATTFSQNLIPKTQLPKNHAHVLEIPRYPLAIIFYSQHLTANDIRLTLLGSLVLSLMFGVLCYFALMLSHSPERAMMRGIKRGDFFVEYQPVFHTDNASLAGVEALLRWQHPTEGRISPDLFIPYAENEGMIVPITRHLFSLIVADLPQLMQALPRGSKLGLNLSPSHLSSPTFHDDVSQFLAKLPDNYFTLVFEITERGMVEEENAQAKFDWLHRQHIEIAIDDFGTGHSALIYLQRFPLDYLKIDRGFVNTIGQDTATVPVLDAIITLAKKLNMLTVAEGVETAEQVNFLRERDVNLMQGYYFSKPLSSTELVEFCRTNTAVDRQT